MTRRRSHSQLRGVRPASETESGLSETKPQEKGGGGGDAGRDPVASTGRPNDQDGVGLSVQGHMERPDVMDDDDRERDPHRALPRIGLSAYWEAPNKRLAAEHDNNGAHVSTLHRGVNHSRAKRTTTQSVSAPGHNIAVSYTHLTLPTN